VGGSSATTVGVFRAGMATAADPRATTDQKRRATADHEEA
jgi:hypothetical protein